jgi:hypothetical protein
MCLNATPVNLSQLEVPARGRVNQACTRRYLFSLNSSIGFVRLCPSTVSLGALVSFRSRNEQFSASSRKSRNCAEAYSCTPHKRFRRLTPKLRKRAIYGRKLIILQIPLIIFDRFRWRHCVRDCGGFPQGRWSPPNGQ